MRSESFQSFLLSCNAFNLTFATMENSIHLKYLVISPTDLKWGMTINSVGFQNIAAHTPYPPNNHPSRYLFSTDNGRVLNEYQLLYITRGGGKIRIPYHGQRTLPTRQRRQYVPALSRRVAQLHAQPRNRMG